MKLDFNKEMVKFYIEKIQEYEGYHVDIVKLNKKLTGYSYEVHIEMKRCLNPLIIGFDTINEIRCFLKGFWYGLPPF